MAYEGGAKYEEEFIITHRGIRLFTCKWLPENKEPKALIFICHGLAAECSVSLTDTAIRLVRAGYALYGIDYEGHGKSSGKRCYISSFDRIVSDCSNHFKSIAEKEENKNKKRFFYGISMGGAVAINMHRKDPNYWNGAILMAPLCKISDEIKPGPILLGALEMLCRIVPTWKLIPSKDMLDKVCKDPELRQQIRSNQYMYMENIPLKTGHQLLVAASEIEKNLRQWIWKRKDNQEQKNSIQQEEIRGEQPNMNEGYITEKKRIDAKMTKLEVIPLRESLHRMERSTTEVRMEGFQPHLEAVSNKTKVKGGVGHKEIPKSPRKIRAEESAELTKEECSDTVKSKGNGVSSMMICAEQLMHTPLSKEVEMAHTPLTTIVDVQPTLTLEKPSEGQKENEGKENEGEEDEFKEEKIKGKKESKKKKKGENKKKWIITRDEQGQRVVHLI